MKKKNLKCTYKRKNTETRRFALKFFLIYLFYWLLFNGQAYASITRTKVYYKLYLNRWQWNLLQNNWLSIKYKQLWFKTCNNSLKELTLRNKSKILWHQNFDLFLHFQRHPRFSIFSSKNDGNIKKNLDKRNQIVVILKELSEAFDKINHSLLLAKLVAYTYVIDNLSKVNRSFSDWTEILEGVPQDSIFGSLLFNIFINDIFLFINNSTLCNWLYTPSLKTYIW